MAHSCRQKVSDAVVRKIAENITSIPILTQEIVITYCKLLVFVGKRKYLYRRHSWLFMQLYRGNNDDMQAKIVRLSWLQILHLCSDMEGK